MKKINNMKPGTLHLDSYCFPVIIAIFLMFVLTDVRAVTITLSRPVALQAETITQDRKSVV